MVVDARWQRQRLVHNPHWLAQRSKLRGDAAGDALLLGPPRQDNQLSPDKEAVGDRLPLCFERK
jgi:hypothetical protein